MYRLHNRNPQKQLLSTVPSQFIQLSNLIVELANQQQQPHLCQIKQNEPLKETQKMSNVQEAVKRIYARYRDTQQHLNKLRQEHLLKESATNTNFHVQNEKSLQIIKSKPSKPIFQRAQEIINQKEFRILNARLQKQSTEEDAGMLPSNRSCRQFDMREFQKKTEKFLLQKKENINLKKMELIAHSYSQLKSKPTLNDKTNKILDKKREFYRQNVLSRFEEYSKKSEVQILAKKKHFNETITPFTPKLNNRTKLLASHSINNLHRGETVFDRISKSPSTTCIKHQNTHHLRSLELKSRKHIIRTPVDDIHDVAFSTPRRNLLKQSSRHRLSQSSKSPLTPILKKLDLRFSQEKQLPLQSTHRVRFTPTINYDDHDRAQTQRGTREDLLRSVVYLNRSEVIQFVKQLILTERGSRQQL